jgi:hypothetical protein
MTETTYLLRSPANAQRLIAAKKRARAGQRKLASVKALIEELEDLRIEAVARERLIRPRKAYMSKKDMDAFIESL